MEEKEKSSSECEEFIEWHPEGYGICVKIRRKLVDFMSEFQHIEIYETANFGKMLVLDGAIQVLEAGEASYHETLVHPAMLAHPRPESVLVIGGGDGGTLREVLKHDVKKATLVEIDPAVVELCRAFLRIDNGSFDDARTEICFEDGFEFLRKEVKSGGSDSSSGIRSGRSVESEGKGRNERERESEDASERENSGKYDVILVDSTDPVRHARGLFSEEFYAIAFSALRENGILVTQAGSIYPLSNRFLHAYRSMKSVFHNIEILSAPVFGYAAPLWGFIAGIKGNLSMKNVDLSRLRGLKLRFYDAEMHNTLFFMPAFVREALARLQRQ